MFAQFYVEAEIVCVLGEHTPNKRWQISIFMSHKHMTNEYVTVLS